MHRMKQALNPRWIGASVALLIALAFVAPAQAQQGPTLQAAMQAYVNQSLGETYAGPCAEADLEDDAGSWCSEIRAQDGQTATVAFGPVFSEFVETVQFELSGGVWQVVGDDFTPPFDVSTATLDSFVHVDWQRGINNDIFCIDTAFSRADLLNQTGSWWHWGCGTTATSHDLTRLACDRLHYLRVWGASAEGSGHSDVVTFQSQPCIFEPPTNPRSSEVTRDGVELAWDRGINNDLYCTDLARSRGDLLLLNDSWFHTGCGNTSTSIEVTGLACGTTYFWRTWGTSASNSGYTPIAAFTTLPCSGGPGPVTIGGDASTMSPAILTDVRVGAHPGDGFDRIVFEFEGDLPAETTISYEDSAAQCGSGRSISVAGSGLLTIVMTSARAHDSGESTVGFDRLTGFGEGAILEAIEYCDFENRVSWAVGTDMKADFEVITLADPSRIVIDIQR